MSTSADAPLSADAAALLAEYYRYADLRDHLRAVPEAAACLGVRDVPPEYRTILGQLEDVVLDRLTRLDALGLYPSTTNDVEITVNGVPIELPKLDRNLPPTVPLHESVTPEREDSMEPTMHELYRDERPNGFDPTNVDEGTEPTFVECYVRPYLGYVATFTFGAVCGVLGTRVMISGR